MLPENVDVSPRMVVLHAMKILSDSNSVAACKERPKANRAFVSAPIQLGVLAQGSVRIRNRTF